MLNKLNHIGNSGDSGNIENHILGKTNELTLLVQDILLTPSEDISQTLKRKIKFLMETNNENIIIKDFRTISWIIELLGDQIDNDILTFLEKSTNDKNSLQIIKDKKAA